MAHRVRWSKSDRALAPRRQPGDDCYQAAKDPYDPERGHEGRWDGRRNRGKGRVGLILEAARPRKWASSFDSSHVLAIRDFGGPSGAIPVT